jgi:hypothetical protein
MINDRRWGSSRNIDASHVECDYVPHRVSIKDEKGILNMGFVIQMMPRSARSFMASDEYFGRREAAAPRRHQQAFDEAIDTG